MECIIYTITANNVDPVYW